MTNQRSLFGWPGETQIHALFVAEMIASRRVLTCVSQTITESSLASGLTVIKYRLVIPENFFQIGQTLAGDCLAYLNLYLLTTQKLLEVLQ